VPPRTPFTH